MKVDKAIEDLRTDDFVDCMISCKQGCNYCCHTQVSVTSDEARLLVLHIKSGVDIDTERLKLQAETFNDSKKWYELDYKSRKCIFLNDEGLCSVYDDRPSVCRSNYVLSPREQCSTEDGNERPVRLLNTRDADMAIVGAFIQSEENGALPYMVSKILEEEEE